MTSLLESAFFSWSNAACWAMVHFHATCLRVNSCRGSEIVMRSRMNRPHLLTRPRTIVLDFRDRRLHKGRQFYSDRALSLGLISQSQRTSDCGVWKCTHLVWGLIRDLWGTQAWLRVCDHAPLRSRQRRWCRPKCSWNLLWSLQCLFSCCIAYW